jgi:hypothetical protein
MRYSLLLLVFTMGLCAVDPITEIRDINDKREVAIAKLDKEAIDKLIKLTKNPKASMAAWQMIHRIDPNNEEATKAVAEIPVENKDLLGMETKSTFPVINQAKATILDKIVKSGKYTERDWDVMPGKGIDVDSKKWNLVVPAGPKRFIMVIPHPTDIWVPGAGFPKTTWVGPDPRSTLYGREGEYDLKSDPTPLKTKLIWEVKKDFFLGNWEPNADRVGTIRVKIFEVQ